jgi:hypothetical protein
MSCSVLLLSRGELVTKHLAIVSIPTVFAWMAWSCMNESKAGFIEDVSGKLGFFMIASNMTKGF